jgi:long-subunit fatty acid transport protein
VALAVGLDVLVGTTEFERALQLADLEGRARFGGRAVGVGFNVAVLVDVVPGRLSAGLHYRSAVDLPFQLAAHFQAPPELRDRVYDQPAESRLVMPHNLSFGVATFPTRNLAITTDIHWTLWSDVKELAVSFPGGVTPGLSAPLAWRDTFSVRVGGEYRALRELLAVRLGAGWDPSPVPPHTLGPQAPVGDRALLSAGLGIRARGFGVDAGYLASFGAARSSTARELPATYRGSLHMISLALSYRWGATGAATAAR